MLGDDFPNKASFSLLNLQIGTLRKLSVDTDLGRFDFEVASLIAPDNQV